MAARAFLKSFFKSGEAVEKYYKFGAKLGSGSFATVVVAKSRETREKVAIKIIHKSGKTNVKLMEQEVEVLNNVHHPNCVSVREIFETDKALYLVMDLCTGGELLAAISRKERFSEAQASAVVKDILQGLQYLHEKGIVHRDLKPENVLLESRDADSRVKISDFGLSKLVQGKRQFLFSRCGTPAYVAPEVILAKPYDSKVDLWAVGVITFLIIAGHPPFYGETLDQLFDVIVRAEFSFYEKYWGHISGPCMHFVEQLLELDPAKRYSAEQALAHPWITGVMPKAPTLRSMAGLQAYSLARSRGVTAGGDPDSDSSASSSSSSSSSSSPSPSAAGSGAIDDSISVVSLSEFGDLPRADPWKYFEEAIGETRVAAGVSLVSSAAVAAAEGAAGRPCAAIFQFQELRDVSKVSEKYSLWPSFILAFRNGRLTGTYDNTLILNEMARPSIQKTRAYELGFIRPFLLLVSLSPYSRLWVAETLGVPLTSYIWYGNPHMEAIELLTAKKGIIARSSRFSDSAFSDFLGKVNWHDTLFRVCERVFTHRSDSDDLKEKMSDYRAFNERVGRSAIQDSCMDPTKAEVIEELESSFTIELVMKMFRFREASGVGMAAPRVFSDLEAVASASPAARRMLENFEVAGFDLTRDSTAVLMFINFYFSQRWMVDADQGSFALFWKRETSKTPLSRLSKTIGYAKLLPAAFTITFQRAILGSIGVPLAPFYPEKRSTL